MIISHKHKFIFIKTRKTAGSSIELSLSRFCGQDDVITPVSCKSEQLRCQEACEPQNFRGLFNPIPDFIYEIKSTEAPVFRGRLLGDHPFFRHIPPALVRIPAVAAKLATARRYFNHIAAEVVRKRVGKRIWESYFKFCFERNPWDKTLSHFKFRNRVMGQTGTLDKYFQEGFFCSDFDAYSINGDIAVDYVGRFEHLQVDLAAICDKIGLPFDGWLPHAKRGGSNQGKPYQGFFTTRRKEIIAEVFAREIESFGYEFDELEGEGDDNIA